MYNCFLLSKVFLQYEMVLSAISSYQSVGLFWKHYELLLMGLKQLQ